MADYQKIVTWIRNFNGLWVECGKQVQSVFPDVDPVILSSIVSREGQNRMRQQHNAISRDIKRILQDYEHQVRQSKCPVPDDILLNSESFET